ncbi:MAG: FAD-dependent oxidoreductase [Panacagrimonas sp.]
MKIAIIGSGIAGLSAAWYLGRDHQVTLYERGERLGMDAQTAQVTADDKTIAVNVPMRVFFPDYYPTLTSLYRELGVQFAPVHYAGSMSDFGGGTYFRYRNYWLGERAIPFLAGRSMVSGRAIKIGWELLRFAKQDGPAPEASETLSEYLRRQAYSERFAEKFLYPAFSGICTCSYDSVRAYPASLIKDYMSSGLLGSRVNRLVNGTQDAAKRMAKAAKHVRLGFDVRTVEMQDAGVGVMNGSGEAARFDHVVIATQANQAQRLLPASLAREKDILSQFKYESSVVAVHRDERLAPINKSEWAPVNFLLSAKHDRPMASIWMNRIHPELNGKANLFETWNPFEQIPSEKLLLQAGFERPTVTPASLGAIDALAELHQQTTRRVWFCGSYAAKGIPLLESAALSAKRVADRIRLTS